MFAQRFILGFHFFALVLFAAACAGATTASPTGTPQATPTTLPTPTSVPVTPTALPNVDGFYDVGGYRLYIECSGEGSPTVILDAGFGGTHTVWAGVRPGVAAFTRVCAYDRANRGASDKGPWTADNPNSALLMANQLKALLKAARIDPPYILVGQSFGGLVVRLYGSAYPTETVGMVLVDAATGETYAASQITPPGEVSFAASVEQDRTAGPFPNIPLIILSHGDANKGPRLPVSEEVWQESQRHLLSLSPRSEQVIAKKSGHNIHYDQPELVIDTIRRVFDQVR